MSPPRLAVYGALVACLALGAAALAAPTPEPSQPELVARGHYLVAFGVCNDCHTPGWREADGKVPLKDWMIGTSTGFRGPWGTVYPANVRQRFAEISESQWLDMVRTRAGHPPMTWSDLRSLNRTDLRAIYAFIRSLGPGGTQSLNTVPREREPSTPYFTLVTPAASSR